METDRVGDDPQEGKPGTQAYAHNRIAKLEAVLEIADRMRLTLRCRESFMADTDDQREALKCTCSACEVARAYDALRGSL